MAKKDKKDKKEEKEENGLNDMFESADSGNAGKGGGRGSYFADCDKKDRIEEIKGLVAEHGAKKFGYNQLKELIGYSGTGKNRAIIGYIQKHSKDEGWGWNVSMRSKEDKVVLYPTNQ